MNTIPINPTQNDPIRFFSRDSTLNAFDLGCMLDTLWQVGDKLPLSRNEWMFLAESFNGYVVGHPLYLSPACLLANVQDAEPTFFDKWQVDQNALCDTIKAFDRLDVLAVISSIQRFFHQEAQ